MPFFVAGLLHVALFAYAAPKLTTAKIEGAREALANDPTSRFYQLLRTGLEEVLV